MYTLYFYPGNASMAPHFMLEDIGAEFQLRRLARETNEHKGAAYLKLNPCGRIPTLIDHDAPGGDLVIFEAAAICLHLADAHPEANLAPALGTPERAHLYQWLIFLTNTIQEGVLTYAYPDRYTTDPDGVPAVKMAAEKRLTDMFAIVDSHLERRDYLLGAQFSLADYYLLMLTRWGRNLAAPPRDLPYLGASVARTLARPAVERAIATEGVPAPFY
ncbi:glutathione S-transferase family protein [Varunaivibrio sulfuroxidans]|uniref:Glutathione S-transferase n=1 Tax=Varunaivibrio sulfuroxidans TaxID=1773489 RepID=A0A4R3JFW4_9PROT|nr:glutathione binding-like protein [Varunaivibrio sulfuroxidans]TCS65028.1 glutathione S-transferase [Varunaivibrio sulfuroxidans]WES29682.1 glutathione binding-like protein [Varunaivibrio sulfuroxidans]